MPRLTACGISFNGSWKLQLITSVTLPKHYTPAAVKVYFTPRWLQFAINQRFSNSPASSPRTLHPSSTVQTVWTGALNQQDLWLEMWEYGSFVNMYYKHLTISAGLGNIFIFFLDLRATLCNFLSLLLGEIPSPYYRWLMIYYCVNVL